MATTIKQRTISAATEKAIQLSNSQFGRLVTLPANWAKVRVGVRYHMSNLNATNLGSTPRFALGLGSGTAQMVGDATCTHFVGAISVQGTWLASGTMYTDALLGACTKVGSTLNTTASFAGVAGMANGANTNTADRSIIFVDITKGSPNYTINSLQINVNAFDFTRDQFYGHMIVNAPTVTNHAFGGTPRTVAVDEAGNGTLNAVQCWWNQSLEYFELCDIAVAILA